ncbi:MAG: hypothetical protein K2Q22_13590 [Cytophagales bacterium]|nr:hypothetical protein [Cytophagales bacterium]
MQKKSTYKAAISVAGDIESHFSDHITTAIGRGEKNIAPMPPKATIETIIDIAFWASLRKEEGHSPRISLAYISPDEVEHPVLFAQRMEFTPYLLNKLAPGFERPGIHLGVWEEHGELYVWGATHAIPSYCFVLDIPEPGLLVIKHRKAEKFGKFTNVAVLNGDEVKLVDENSGLLPNCPNKLTSLLGFHESTTSPRAVNVLVQLAVSMRSHGRGGTLLIVPKGNELWKKSIRQPINYAIEPAFSGLANLVSQNSMSQNQFSLEHEISALAGLTAIDGAIVITEAYELLAFGAKITRPEGQELVEQILVTEPVVGGKGEIVHPVQSGGTRHLSAAQFVHDQQDSIALVASQDGRFTLFAWSPIHQMVQAHRIEVLLL